MASHTLKTWTQNLLMTVVSVGLTLVLAEIALRLVYPKYELAAEAQFQPDSLRITTRPANARHTVNHPDNGRTHLVIYNNHGMRQHRDFAPEDLADAVNVGFFGDSYMENLGLPGPYSFTEPLDYLLNRGEQRFNVLNFGQSGYGTDQSYLAYRYSELGPALDHVFYVFCINDIRNIYENDLFFLDDNGELQRNPALATPWWIKLISRLHLTYLLQDGYNRLFPRKNAWQGFDARIMQEKHADKHVRKRMRTDRAKSVEDSMLEGEDNPDVTRALAVFQVLLKRWRDLARANGAEFSLVLLPTGYGSLVTAVIPEDIRVIDLHARFDAAIPDYRYDDWHFENDRHWAEAANRLAATIFYREIAGQAAREALAEDEIDQALFTYYSAFDYGWMPATQSAAEAAVQPELEQIAGKYAALEQDTASN
ncbi:MAG: SGNH/GDSL hydrolase family protein [Chromatiales bacterium]|nr:MAG: SGNH/GDSL hydrolase family protein [Chromatiales bacterium]